MDHVERIGRPVTLEVAVAGQLRAELGRQGRSRRWLAAQTELPLTTVARWVKGDTGPSLDELDAICRALGITVGRLIYLAERDGVVVRRPVAAAAS